MSKEIAKAKSPNEIIEGYKKQLEKALPRVMDADRFVRILATTVRSSDKLTQIAMNNPVSLLSACMEVAQSGLDPSVPNEIFLVPYGNEIACQYGYKGLAKLAIESAQELQVPLTNLRQEVICENDIYEREGGDNPQAILRYPPFGTDRGKVLGYLACSCDVHGRKNFVEMTVKEVQEHKERFCKAKSGPFADARNFDAYGLKTALRRLISRYLSMGPKLSRAIVSDIKAETQEEPTIIQENRNARAAACGAPPAPS